MAPTDVDHLRQRARTGVLWVFVDAGVRQVLTLAISIVLARLLLPEDFGTVGTARLFLEVSTVVGNAGMAGAIIQRETIGVGHHDTAFATSTAAGAMLALLFVLIAHPVATFFSNPAVAPIMQIMSLQVVLAAMSATPLALLQRELRFRAVAVLSLVQTLSNGVIAITLALLGFGVWSIVWSSVASAAAYLVVALMAARYWPRLHLSRSAFGELIGFGSALTAKNIFVYISRNIDNFVIAQRLGAAALGFYTRAFALTVIPQRQFVSQLNQVSFPAFARLQTDYVRLRAWFLKGSRTAAIVSVPALVLLAGLASDFTLVLYTDRWAGMIGALQLLCIAGAIKTLHTLAGAVFEATGSLRYDVISSFGNGAVVAVGAYLACPWGIEGVAIAVVGAALGLYIVHGFILRQLIALPLRDYFGVAFWPTTVSLGAMLAVVLIRNLTGMDRWLPAAAVLMTSVLLFGLVYVGFFIVFPRIEFAFLADEVRHWTRRFLPVGRATPGVE